MATTSQVMLETCVITVGRVFIFLACRQYLLRSLYHDLRHLSPSALGSTLSQPSSSHESAPHNSDLELDELPSPATTPRTNSNSPLHPQHHKSEYNWHSTLSCLTFSLCFSESCILFILVLSQAVNVFLQRSRYLNWRLSLGILLCTILLGAPLQQCLLLTYQSSSKTHNSRRHSIRSHVVLTGIPYIIYLLALSYIPLPSRLDSPDFTIATLSRLVVLGTVILGILAGYGAASAVFTYIQLLGANREPVSDAQIIASAKGLSSVRSDLQLRQRQIEQNASLQSESQRGFFSRLYPFSNDPELSSLRREIQGLEMLEYQMGRNLEYMQQRRLVASYAGTLRGRLWIWVGKSFALYCGFRVINSIVNLVYPLSTQTVVSTPDLLASLLARVVTLFLSVTETDIAATSRQFSFFLVGAIILSSIRRAMRGVARALKVTSKSLAASLLLLFLAQLMGTYLLSTLIQLRTSFPSQSADENLNLFTTLPEYHVFGPLWDAAFLTSVAFSGVMKWLDEKVNGPGLR